MIHLKKFEGYLDQPEYWEMERDDFLNLFYRDQFEKLVTISPNVVKRVKERIPDTSKLSLVKSFPKRKEQSILISDRWEVVIYELKDEWFVVIDDNQYFFKCDGTTGLFKCLEDRQIIKNK